MIKPFAQMLFLRVLPGFFLAVMLVSVSFPWLQVVHAPIARALASLTMADVQTAVTYQLSQSKSSIGALSVSWPGGTKQTIHAFQNSKPVSDYIDDVGLTRTQVIPILNIFNTSSTLIESTPASGLWRPAIGDYKQLVYRDFDDSHLDQIINRGFNSADIEFGSIKSGFYQSPVDPFGGIYLHTTHAPRPVEALAGDLFDVQISRYDALSEQFLKEVWAINNQQWSVLTVGTLLAAGFVSVLPWLLFGRVTKLTYAVLGVLVLNVICLFVFYTQLRWFYPLVIPALSPIFAWIWFREKVVMNNRLLGIKTKHRDVTELWVGHLLDEGKPEAAFRYLKEEQIDEKMFNPLWNLVAKGFERNRQFDKSIECYQSILELDSSNSDAKQKIKKLSNVIDGSKTINITQSAGELPVGQVDDLSLGRYQISKELGRGAMGIVYEAIDPKINRKVALKVVHLKNLGLDEVDQVKQRFFREAQAAGKLNHPNIVTVFDVGEEHDVAYIAMDLLVGKPLSNLINKKPIVLLKVVKWIAEAAEALGYAHENDIVHRDVKPANMIIEQKTNRLKLTDFGVARIAGVQQTQTGIVLGSPSYMSPEQIRGEKLTGATDIFSLGVTLFQCLTGELPFAGDTLPALAYSITQSKQDSPRTLNEDVPVSLVRIVNKALQKDPEERFASAHDFAKSLNKWVKDNS